MAAAYRSRISVRTLAVASTILFGVLVVALAIAMTWASKRVWDAGRDAERHLRGVTVSSEIERTLHEYHRLWNLFLATRDPEADALRMAKKSDLDRRLLEMHEHVEGAEAVQLLSDASRHVAAYLAEGESLEARELPLEQVVRAIRPSLERALASSATLHEYKETRLRQAERAAARMLRLEVRLALGVTAFLVAGLISVVLGVRALVLRPIFALGDAMRRFRAGDVEVRAHGGAARETRELAATFNEMAETIAKQRRDQLTFLAGVAHDLRNPLAALKMAAQMLERDRAPVTPGRIQRIDQQIDRLARMVDDLLDATRIEAGQLDLQLEALDLREPARAMVELYAPTTTTHEVILRAPDHPVIVRGDPLRIEQVLSNLLSNAIKYSPAGGPVEVAVTAGDTEAELAVSDRGIGISPDELRNIFQPFRRRRATAGVMPGAGLGLSIVRRIVGAHGGRVDVESVPGEGSTFRVRLPLVAVLEREREERRHCEEPRPEAR